MAAVVIFKDLPRTSKLSTPSGQLSSMISSWESTYVVVDWDSAWSTLTDGILPKAQPEKEGPKPAADPRNTFNCEGLVGIWERT